MSILDFAINWISDRYNVEKTKFIANSRIGVHFDDVENGFAILVETKDAEGAEKAKKEWKENILGEGD